MCIYHAETADKELEEDGPSEGPEKPRVANVVAAVDEVSDLEYLKSRKQSTTAFEEAEDDQEQMESDADEEAEGSKTRCGSTTAGAYEGHVRQNRNCSHTWCRTDVSIVQAHAGFICI